MPAHVIPTVTTRQVLSTHFTGLVRLSDSSKGIGPMNKTPRTRGSDSEVPFLIHSPVVSDYGGPRTGKVEVRTHTLDDEGRTGEGTGFCCGIEVRPVLEPCRDAQDRAKCLKFLSAQRANICFNQKYLLDGACASFVRKRP